ncbi:protein of unknown function DUF302 [Desulfotomaculum nigrificans CO-1-SRB]|uniref:DUF302 domain-containing protein n=1 Tax=Desulfotomaculum nigrificans (strain DSM 14880 / VKM B-2319 / CO-1-SRB) TaxID=868595 RepID=F6B6V6_DESCC|nr:DUF302 domain-containing protein [Desulfotomaculum nigrificans]AEF93281.1 protein of unknown function DUF302 [Desulfotomaculum nigrificans CO-1-SRB]
MFDYTVSTSKDFETAVADLENALKERKFGVLWKLDMKEKLAEKGVDFAGQFKILEVCNPQKAKQALESNIKVGYFLPCKVVVYVEDGQTKMGTVRPSNMMNMIEGGVPENLAAEVDEILTGALNAAK